MADRYVPRHGRARKAGRGTSVAGAHHGRASKAAGLLVALAVVITAVPFLGVSGASGDGFVPARSAQFNSGGFPEWYQDANGIRVQPCLDPALTDCLAPLANAGIYDPALPLSFPSNYPDEIFYSAVDADLTPVADCAVNPGDGLTVHLALEASFAGGAPLLGDQTIFGRIRFNAKGSTGLCPNTWYTFRTPYGPYTYKTDSKAEITGKVAAANTTDIGCITAPCTFDEPFAAPVLGVGLLRLAAGATPGYLGNSTTFGPIVGGKDGFNSLQVVRWPAGVTPAATGFGADCPVTVTCTVKATQNNFNVLAKLAGPLDVVADSIDFGGVVTGQSAVRDITITNIGSGPLGLADTTLQSAVVTGAGSGSYAVSLGTCDTVTAIARDASCTLQVTFSPTADGAAGPASLVVTPVGGGDPVTVQLAGTGVQPEQVPVIGVDPTTVDFGRVRYRTSSDVRNVTITNSGIAPLTLQHAISNSGAWASDFSIAATSCPTGVVAPNGGTCVVSVRFVPSHTGLATADLVITSNDLLHPSVTVTLQADAWGGVAAVSSSRTNGFPDWYQDERGVRVGQCADPASAMCIAAPLPGVGPLSFPDNYPDEAFYYIMNSDDVLVSDPACQAGDGALMVEAGMEAAFFTNVADGDQMTFGRIRFVAGRKGGLCPNTQYEVLYPYGKDVITTDADGAVKPSPGTTDIGCGTPPCDFTLALSSPVAEGFLEQTGHPAGYLGNPTVFTTVSGAPFVDPSTGQPANHVTIRNVATGVVLGSTDRFAVSGRLAGPVVASPAALDLGSVLVSSGTSTASTVLSNVGQTPVTLDGSAFSVSGTGDFTVDGTSTCVGGFVLDPNSGNSCTVVMAFDPSSTGQRTATLVVNHNGLNDPLELSLTGVGQADPAKPAISVQPSGLAFTDRSVATVSETQTIIVSNLGGQAPLTVGVPTVNSAEFEIENLCGAPVDPDLSCAVNVRFRPTTVGSHVATVTIPSDAGEVTVALTGDAVDVDPAVAAVRNSADLPIWVQDDDGVRLQQCLTVQNCVLLGDATFDPGKPVAFPGNYPTESFYFLADSELLTVPPHSCGLGAEAVGGTAFLRMVTEASFPAGPAAGGPAVFNRIRVNADGLCANFTYHFINPYGDTQVTADGNGVVKQTIDLPNLPSTEPVFSGFVQWDPNIAPAAPAGHLGDGSTFHEIVGSNYRPTALGEPANYFEVQTFDGTPVVRGTKFIVAGQMVGVVADATSLAFGTVRQGKTSTVQSVTVSNIGKTSVGSIAATLTGADPGVFTISGNTCTGVVLAKDQSCTISIVLAPSDTELVGDKAATLEITHDGLGAPMSVDLAGKVITSAMPALTVNPTSLNFATQVVNTAGTSQTVTISNTGTAPMRVAPLAISGGAAGNFQIVTTSDASKCSIAGAEPSANIAASSSCTITVRFTPTSIGAKAASIVVKATDPATGESLPSITVSLAGTGTQGTASLSATSLTVSSRAGRTATASVKITNTGTANFTLQSSQVNITANATSVRVSGNTCSNIAPRKTCQVTVSFQPTTAIAIGAPVTADIYLRPPVASPGLSVTNTVQLPDGSFVSGVKFRVNATRAR